MANVKISDLSALSTTDIATGDQLVIVDISEAADADKTKNVTLASLFGWQSYTPTITVSGGTAPTYTERFVSRYLKIGNLVVVYGAWENSAGGTAGSGTGIMKITLPFLPATEDVQVGVAGLENGATLLGNLGVYLYDTYFTITKSDWSELIGNDQNSVTRRLTFTFVYEAA